MQNTNQTDHGFREMVDHARRNPTRWLIPTLLVCALGLGYALVYQPDWEASQTLTVRDDFAEADEWSGGFNEAEQLKHAQETFLELAKSPAVISTALQLLGPPAGCTVPEQWPGPQDVGNVRDKIEVMAPNGMEFGTTRMLYLTVADPNPQRAIELATAICDASEKRFRELRDQQITDAIAELTNTVELSQQELGKATAKLQKMETTAGSDLSELRMLSESMGGGSNFQTTLAEVRQELRQAESTFSSNQQLLNLLTAAQEDTDTLVATPNRLLESQPALRRLKEGLIDAQLNSSQLLGTMSNEHPRVRAALVAESEIRGHLHRELEQAVRGLRAEQALFESQINLLTQKIDDLQRRLQKLAEMRATYANQLAEVRQRTEGLTTTQQELDAARAKLAAGDVITLVTRVDAPQTGPYPTGPQRSVIAAAGCAGGLLVGLGLLVLTLPAPGARSSEEDHTRQTGGGPNPARAAMPTQGTVRPPAKAPAPMPSLTSIGGDVPRGMTLKEALARCNTVDDL